ncbi:4-hydroxy-tetrahydrodipicolinate synthase [Thermotoga sp. Ku-13t]|uniref:4-hydroxy-tetrahydrodipicolinate synthase n=1 Tax=Thermotoga sp. Ku-13t TaxID=1755813 RepID=UPI0013EA1CC8|nr:4-hydroxy-tetrahydrodipicolinate synthase [Thermotoga sp. Ku-13t]KAF2957260.1 4-hydroxy-tetrahydrodipicolinate synthase [Thermotoga sp. Ku-13t]
MSFVPKGVIPAVVTPMNKDESINESAFRRLLNYLVDNGVHGVFIIGSQGEFYALTKEEKIRLMEIAVEEVNGRVPVYAGTGGITTREVIELNNAAEKIGVDAVSIITPYYISPSQEELYEHYVKIARATKLPVLLYNNPGRTGGVKLEPRTVERLAEIDNIVGIKDSSGDLTNTSDYIRRTRGKNFHVLAGRDTLILATLLYGGTGSIAATANVAPRLVASIYDYFVKGDLENAKRAQEELTPLRLAFELGTFPVVIKEALNMIGIEAGPARGPIKALSEEKKAELRKVLQNMKLL